jgi:biotin carboxyl carrier protein
MQYDVEIDGRLRQVVVERVRDGFAVRVGDRQWTVDAARVAAGTLSLVVREVPGGTGAPLCPLEGGHSHEVTIVAAQPAGSLVVNVGPVALAVSLSGRRRWGRGEEGRSDGPQRITAPMPGRVVRVLVEPGAAVQPRQPILVIEAMKMENELRAAAAGTVKELYAHEGQLVDAGALLAVVGQA